MHLIRRFAVLLLLAAPAMAAPLAAPPAQAAETDTGRFPFATGAGVYRDLVVYPGESRALRVVFPVVTVERPSKTRAILRPGGDGRVIVEIAGDGTDRFTLGAELHFGQAPVILESDGERTDIRLSLRALALPLVDSPGGALGRIAFEGMLATLSWPTGLSPAIREARFALKAAGTRADALLFAPGAAEAPTLKTGAVDIAGRLDLRMVEPPSRPDALMRSVTRARLDRGSVEMLDGRVVATGSSRFSPGDAMPVRDLRARLAFEKFSTMVQRLMLAGVLTPRQVMPLAVVAGSLGTLSPEGTLGFAIETTPEGVLVVNGKPLVPPGP